MDRHPEWPNNYNRVGVVLTNQDCDGIFKKVRPLFTSLILLTLNPRRVVETNSIFAFMYIFSDRMWLWQHA